MKPSCRTVFVAVISSVLAVYVFAAETASENLPPEKNIYAEKGFIHVLGPSPALVPGEEDSAWDSRFTESGDVFKDVDTYYWYYHARSDDRERWPGAYRIGVATAPTPLGPWKKYENNPVLDHGPEGSWDQDSVDGAVIMKEGAYDVGRGSETYFMWYAASGPTGRHIGLATASNPLGPWKKHEGNPIVKDFGYLGGVVKVDGKFFMFVQYPVEVTDQGPFRVAMAEKPEGPWTKYEGNPVMTPGDWGAWDDGGYSEARVRYHEGVFHMFYGGTKTSKIESIGYAYSFDGFNWIKYGANPVVDLSRVPDGSGFAEVHAYIEGPFVYVYHTLRTFSKNPQNYREWETEDLAVQVLTIDPRFKIAMPILFVDILAAGQCSRLQDCLPIGLESASNLAISTECTYGGDPRAGLLAHLRTSENGVIWDTVDYDTFELPFDPGKTVKKTVALSPKVKFVKVLVENPDESHSVTSVKITATIGN